MNPEIPNHQPENYPSKTQNKLRNHLSDNHNPKLTGNISCPERRSVRKIKFEGLKSRAKRYSQNKVPSTRGPGSKLTFLTNELPTTNKNSTIKLGVFIWHFNMQNKLITMSILSHQIGDGDNGAKQSRLAKLGNNEDWSRSEMIQYTIGTTKRNPKLTN